MRAISFVDRLELDFTGNINKNAMCLGDVNNDGLSELTVGSLSGELGVFTGDSSTPQYTARDVGIVTCLQVGDVFNIGHNMLLVVTAEGWTYVFNVPTHPDTEQDANTSLPLVEVHCQRLTANALVALLKDVDGDGNTELLLGLTDRVVRMYRWVGSCSGGRVAAGKLVGLQKWEFPSQIGGLSASWNSAGPVLLVSQPGGTCYSIPVMNCYTSHHDSCDEVEIEYYQLAYSRMRNPNILTDIVGNISYNKPEDSGEGEEDGSPYSVATLDGTLMLCHADKIIWSIQVDRQLNWLYKLDVTGDGNEEIVVCAWDGHTYIVNKEQKSVRFQFEESVCTFCAGVYGYKQENKKCLVYVTFNNKIYIYYNLHLPEIQTVTSQECLRDSNKFNALYSELSKDEEASECSEEEERSRLTRYLLYSGAAKV